MLSDTRKLFLEVFGQIYSSNPKPTYAKIFFGDFHIYNEHAHLGKLDLDRFRFQPDNMQGFGASRGVFSPSEQ